MLSFGEYVYHVIKENPDDLYSPRHRPFFTFIFVDDCVIYSANEDNTHTEILQYLMMEHGNTRLDGISKRIVKNQINPADIKIIGNIGEDFAYWLESVSGDVWMKFSKINPYVMLGRLSKHIESSKKQPHKNMISLLYRERRMNQQNIDNIKTICNELDVDVNDCLFEFGPSDEKVFLWDELAPSTEIPTDEPKISPVIHTLDPAIKGNVMKQQGIMPKQNMVDIKDRYAMNQ